MTFSVIIPLFNKEKSIFNTLQSVLNQSYKSFEVLLVDDGSTDNSIGSIKSLLLDPRVRLISKENGGVSSARNLGIVNSKFNYLAFIDGDDLWLPNHLNVIKRNIEFPEYSECVGFVTGIIKSKTGTFPNCCSDYNEDSRIINNYVKFATKPNQLISSSSFVVKKNIAIKYGMYKENLTYGEDVEFWYRTFKHEKIVKTDIVTAVYNIGAENRSDLKPKSLNDRFHLFNFEQADEIERRYFGKLVAILILDYFLHKDFRQVLTVTMLYKKYLKYVFIYFSNLMLKNI